MVVPYDYARDLARDRPTTLQFLLNAMNANTATISQAYAEGVIQTYNSGLQKQGIHIRTQQVAGSDLSIAAKCSSSRVSLQPGLVDSCSSSRACSACC